MDHLIEEYGYIIITAICASVMLIGFNEGLTEAGFISETITTFIKTIIGG